ncbi:hypothetical protein BS47DRAFT_587589 [Hydnum rufescens UP504]|uniref:Uncharacterized protein n=1 Tax=Hydnum rufescens UP504 TaxID=1448309 RepID=A0A9P6B3G3_9AGAM|nr:hypothetical protein BS47DRAFT_587589 [Hydnum rufescens UP504]
MSNIPHSDPSAQEILSLPTFFTILIFLDTTFFCGAWGTSIRLTSSGVTISVEFTMTYSGATTFSIGATRIAHPSECDFEGTSTAQYSRRTIS